MNRRDALKSFLALPVAAVAVPMAVEPVSLGYVDLSGFTAAPMPDSFMETIPGLRSMGPITVSMNWTPEAETVHIKGVPTTDTDGNPIRINADFDLAEPALATIVLPGLGVFRDTGERGTKGRRIFA